MLLLLLLLLLLLSVGLPRAFEYGLQDCSDFYPCPGGPANRWIFGDNRGGAITGLFDRESLTFTADRPQLDTGATDRRLYSYDCGAFGYPKTCKEPAVLPTRSRRLAV